MVKKFILIIAMGAMLLTSACMPFENNAEFVEETETETIILTEKNTTVDEWLERNYIDTVEYNGHVYALSNFDCTWKEAKEMCNMFGGNLATITSFEEQEIIEGLIASSNKEAVWLGGYKDEEWQWVTDEAFTYTNWSFGEPNGGSKEMFLQIYTPVKNDGTEYEWDDTYYTGDLYGGITVHDYVCEWASKDDIILEEFYHEQPAYLEKEIYAEFESANRMYLEWMQEAKYITIDSADQLGTHRKVVHSEINSIAELGKEFEKRFDKETVDAFITHLRPVEKDGEVYVLAFYRMDEPYVIEGYSFKKLTNEKYILNLDVLPYTGADINHNQVLCERVDGRWIFSNYKDKSRVYMDNHCTEEEYYDYIEMYYFDDTICEYWLYDCDCEICS